MDSGTHVSAEVQAGQEGIDQLEGQECAPMFRQEVAGQKDGPEGLKRMGDRERIRKREKLLWSRNA